MCFCVCVVSVSPVTDELCQFGNAHHKTNVISRRWAPTSDIDSVSFVESLSDSDEDYQRSVSHFDRAHWLQCLQLPQLSSILRFIAHILMM